MAVENSYTQQRQVEGPSGKGVSHGFAVVFWPKQGLSVQYRSIPPSSGQISPHGVKWAGQLNFSTCDNEPESRWPETAHSNKRQPKEKSVGHSGRVALPCTHCIVRRGDSVLASMAMRQVILSAAEEPERAVCDVDT